ncbi:hypothetical protein K461DRAFT_280287 [Myriangium duriaei CBS 260.36]|uniref:Uncharacterized protein n=1 Tax=Myriangium duriaei CBS 260.36 TaxID=1168546 RepID=A0A9P4IX17_9PEZI|nr:hypothetical protein K461DRAFT_280287 [Myriangium duriaei CBS 260.36]
MEPAPLCSPTAVHSQPNGNLGQDLKKLLVTCQAPMSIQITIRRTGYADSCNSPVCSDVWTHLGQVQTSSTILPTTLPALPVSPVRSRTTLLATFPPTLSMTPATTYGATRDATSFAAPLATQSVLVGLQCTFRYDTELGKWQCDQKKVIPKRLSIQSRAVDESRSTSIMPMIFLTSVLRRCLFRTPPSRLGTFRLIVIE